MPLSDSDQRILAGLDAQVATGVGSRAAARLRRRCSALGLNLATLALTFLAYGLLAVGVAENSRPGALAAVLLLVAAPTPAVLAFRYADRDDPAAGPVGSCRFAGARRGDGYPTGRRRAAPGSRPGPPEPGTPRAS